ncbi:MAG: GxxExxY protein [Candidatus Lindowbacteria bacterium]|nr:GxxExxY protein [Candidatus Lindowbacteria bacterium]
MNADRRRLELDRITKSIVGCAYKVSNTLGAGFVEKVYENALVLELQKAGLKTEQQYPIRVKYDGVVVGEFSADLLVEQSVIVELKAMKNFDEVHVAQCMNYPKATGLPVCLLVNFGKPKAEVRRIVQDFQFPICVYLRSSAVPKRLFGLQSKI